MTEQAPTPDALIGPVKPHRVPPKLQAAGVLIITLGAMVAVIAGAAVNYSLSRSGEKQQSTISRQQTLIADLSHNLDATRDQVKAIGETPVSPPASVVTDNAGVPGKAGTNGTNGRDGTSVAAVICQASGSWLITYSNGSSQQASGPCVAQDGADGQTVVGPPGKDGANGMNGTDGLNGANGAPGEPPVSWTWVSTSGLTRVCTRTDPFDPTAPTYTCSTSPQGETR